MECAKNQLIERSYEKKSASDDNKLCKNFDIYEYVTTLYHIIYEHVDHALYNCTYAANSNEVFKFDIVVVFVS